MGRKNRNSTFRGGYRGGKQRGRMVQVPAGDPDDPSSQAAMAAAMSGPKAPLLKQKGSAPRRRLSLDGSEEPELKSFGALQKAVRSLAGPGDEADPASAVETVTLTIEDRPVRVTVDARLVKACGSSDDILQVLQHVAKHLPDRADLANFLPAKGADITLLGVTGGTQLIETGDRWASVALESGAASGETSDEVALAVRRALVALAVFRGVRVGRGPAKVLALEARRAGGILVLALSGDPVRHRKLTAKTVGDDLSKRVPEDDLARTTVVDALAEHPLSRIAESVIDPEATIYANLPRFDEMSLFGKLKVIVAGHLAWYTSLSLGLLYLLKPVWEGTTGHYNEARAALSGGLMERGMVKAGLKKKVTEAWEQGKRLRALELVWSAWNPSLQRVTTRPVYRMLGGNSRPFTATFLTFVFSGLITHCMLWTSLALLGLRSIADPSGNGFAAVVSQDMVLIIQGLIILVYVLLGLGIGLRKTLRRAQAELGSES